MSNSVADIKMRYDISSKGFLPEEPLRSLTECNICYDEWENLMVRLPYLNKNKLVREAVDQLCDFNLTNLSELYHYKRAYSLLSILTNAYVFSNIVDDPIDVIPAKLAVPLCFVSNYIGIVPIMTHASVDLYNWYLENENGDFSLDNLKSTYLYTGTRDEEWFYIVTVKIEQIGGQLIDKLLAIYCDNTNISKYIKDINGDLIEMCNILGKMIINCNSDAFFNGFRKYLAGSKNNDSLPNGIIYQGIDNIDQYRQYYGGSAAQSSLLHVIDNMLGISHTDNYFAEMVMYMPQKHREFILFVHDNINLYEICNKINLDLDDDLNTCKKTLQKFRKIHMSFAKKYIVKYINNNNNNSSPAKGTGGTLLVDFLETSINETI